MDASFGTQGFTSKNILLLAVLVASIFAVIALLGFCLVTRAALGRTVSLTTHPTFRETRSIPDERERLTSACIDVGGHEFVYAVGGQDSSPSVTDTVFYAEVLPNGAIDSWRVKNGSFQGAVFKSSALVSTHGRLYSLGGNAGRDSIDLVYETQPEQGTGDTVWSPTTPLSVPVYLHTAVALGDRIYVMGGYHNDDDRSISRVVTEVFSAQILPSGELSGWQPESSLESFAEDGLWAHAAVAMESERFQCIYVVGGWRGSLDTGGPHKGVFRACIKGGKLGGWVEQDELPLVPGDAAGIFDHSAAIFGNRVFVIGGAISRSETISSVYIGSIDVISGYLGGWEVCADCLPRDLELHGTAVASNGVLYIVGGKDRNPESSVYNEVLFTPLLDFEKLGAPEGPVTYGDTIIYTLKLANLGVRDLEELIITDTVQTNVPAALEFHDYPQDKCGVPPGATSTITCTVPSLALGGTTELSFAVTISPSTPALLSAPTSPQDPLAAPTSHINWTQACSPVRLEVLGVGISDTLTSTLAISSPETIVSDSIRAQAAFRIIRPGGEVDEVTFCSGGDCYRLTEPASTCRDSVVYELDVPVSDAISVTFECDDDVRPSGLIAYFLRRTREGHSLVGCTMNQFLYRETYTNVLELPFPRHSGDITVRAIATDNNVPNHVVSLTVQAGERITSTTFSTPSHGNYLDIRELRLSDVSTTTDVVTVVAQSPLQDGESFGMAGLIVMEANCTSAPTSVVRVLNRAEACEHVGADRWCWYATYFNTELRVYLPIALKNSL